MFKNKVILGNRPHASILILLLLLIAGTFAHGWYVERELLKLRRQNGDLKKVIYGDVRKVIIEQMRVLKSHSQQLKEIDSKLRFAPTLLDISGMKKDISSLNTEFTRIDGRLGSIETKFSFRPGGIYCKESIFGTLQCGF